MHLLWRHHYVSEPSDAVFTSVEALVHTKHLSLEPCISVRISTEV